MVVRRYFLKQNVARDEPADFLALFVLLMGLMCGFVLSLPEFPSQDGPIHVYYAHVLTSLFQHGTIYQPYFYIRSPHSYLGHHTILRHQEPVIQLRIVFRFERLANGGG